MTDVSPSIVVRVDGGRQIGSGHVSRCLTLANELTRRGARVLFICRELPGNLIEKIERERYSVVKLPAPSGLSASSADISSAWLQVPSAQDAEETRAILDRTGADWLVVDHYGIDAQWERAQRPVVESIFVIDDLADRSHDCDMLLDQNHASQAAADRYSGRVPEHCRVLLGPRYALLSREYATLREVLVRRPAKPRNVLVFFGGTDATDETSKALHALCTPEIANLTVDVVLGPNHPEPQRVEALVASRPGTVLHRNLPSLAGLMFRADLAIGAGGATTWERLCLGLPSVVITVAANQEASTASLAAEGLVVWAGRAPSVSVEDIASAVRGLLGKVWSDRSIVDGLGASRVVASLLPPSPESLRLEQAQASDAELLLQWRNDPQARAMSFDSGIVGRDTHLQWFHAQMADPRVQILIGRSGDLPLGQVRLDFRAEQAVLSYSVDADMRGLGFGAALVELAVRSANRVPPAGYRAHVKAGNVASRRIFKRLGWSETSAESDFIYCLDADALLRRSR